MLIFGHNMTSRVHFGWKPTTTAIFVGIRHVGVNAPHTFSQNPPLKRPYMRDWRPPVRTPTPILVKIGVCGGFGLKPHHAT